MEVLAVIFGIGALISTIFWLYTETPKGKEWIKNL